MTPQSPRSLNPTGLNAVRDADRELAIVWPLLGRHVAFHRRLVDVTESVKAALLLSQAIYWTRHGRDIAVAAGWFSKTSDQWARETGMSIKEQASARAALRDLAILEERREGLPAKLHFRLRAERLAELLLDGMGAVESESQVWTDATLANELLGPSLAYHRVLAGVGGGVHAGLMLSRALHLTRRHAQRPAGAWIHSSVDFWHRELGLNRREQETTRRDLAQAGIWEESLVGAPPRLVARVRLEALVRILAAPMPLPTSSETQSTGPAHFGESGMWESRSLVLPKAPKQICRNRRHRFAESAAPNIRITRTTTTTTTPPRYESNKPPRYESGTPPRYESGTPRYESNAGGACEVGQTNAALVLPAGLTSDESTAILRLVEPWPAQAQALLDELDARLRAGAVRTNPVAYLHGMVKRAAEGRFVPEAGLAASADRRRRDLQAIRSRREDQGRHDQRRRQQGACSAIDRDADRAAGRAVLRQLLAMLGSERARKDES
jgi:hypothetical protein